ncbi:MULTISPECIES: hypothetical protein [unclassified Streptomyces]|uniref:hypothetical protein n=1 Tax=unclassified Streptomyces TaxID=2593676 RepID=UPI00081F0A89|nr:MULTISPECIES: hypothetical protein [unclassified Streptomyces]MYZ37508.1 hypothetical protein [Streptomyces sp. SID4917]SCF91854.1 hypothetical protein GA0115259_1048214 [Streptomyces sp. MnatMP-M17]
MSARDELYALAGWGDDRTANAKIDAYHDEVTRGNADWLEGIGQDHAASMLRYSLDLADEMDTVEKASAPAPTATPQPDFFQPGHGYTHRDGSDFLTVAVTNHPITGERLAMGWRSEHRDWHRPAVVGINQWNHEYDGVAPPAPEPLTDRQQRLLAEIQRRPRELRSSSPVAALYREWGVHTSLREARHDLYALAQHGYLTASVDVTGRRYDLNTRKDGAR